MGLRETWDRSLTAREGVDKKSLSTAPVAMPLVGKNLDDA